MVDNEVKNDLEEEEEEDLPTLEFDEDDPQFKTHFVHKKWKRFALKSLYCISYKNKCRKKLVWLVEWRWFEIFITILIILNSILLGVYDYKNQNSNSYRNQIVDQSEIVFTILFTIECLIKILAMGFIAERGCYLRDAWNWLDFIVVVTSLLQFVIPANVSVLRTFRLIRPLRSLSSVPSMRLLVSTLISSLWQLGSILALALFFFTVFAILGVSLWQGVQHYRCRETSQPVQGDWVPVDQPQRLCGGSYRCPAGKTCGSLIEAYLDGYYIDPAIDLYRDTSTQEFLYGYTTFDNFPLAFLTIFQSVTLQGWTTVLYFIGDAYNIYVSALYFVFCIVICSYFLLNLTVAVMLENFSSLNKSEDLYKQKIEKMLRAARLALTAQVFIRMMTGAVAAKQALREQHQIDLLKANESKRLCLEAQKETVQRHQNADPSVGEEAKQHISQGRLQYSNLKSKEEGTLELELASARGSGESAGALFHKREREKRKDNHDTERSKHDEASVQQKTLEYLEIGKVKQPPSRIRVFFLGKEEETRPPSNVKYYKNCFTRSFYTLVSTPIFNYTIFIFIMVNTVILSLDRYPEPSKTEQQIVEGLNYFFTAIFTVEMLFKIIGLGFVTYLRDGFNILDAIVVVFSLIELGFQGGNVVSSLRALRLLRIMKLARSWDSLRLLINSIMHTLTSIGPFTVLLSLFIYVAALMGMQFFAGRIPGPPRAHFDELHSAIITIFIVLVGENWNEVMFDTTNAIGWGATVYFIFLVVIGNFVMLNLFLAILLGNFEEARAIMNNIKKLEKEMKRNSNQLKRRSLTLIGVSAAGGIRHISKREIATVKDPDTSNSKEESLRENPLGVNHALDQISKASPQLQRYVQHQIRRPSFTARAQNIQSPTLRQIERVQRLRDDSSFRSSIMKQGSERPQSDNSYQGRSNSRMDSPTLLAANDQEDFQNTGIRSSLEMRETTRNPLVIDTARSKTLSMQANKVHSRSSSVLEEIKHQTDQQRALQVTHQDCSQIYRSRSDVNIRSILENSKELEIEEIPSPLNRKNEIEGIRPFRPELHKRKKSNILINLGNEKKTPPHSMLHEHDYNEEFISGVMSDQNRTADARILDSQLERNSTFQKQDQFLNVSSFNATKRLTLKDLEVEEKFIKLPTKSNRRHCCRFMRESSLFLFHRESALRKCIIKFTVPPKLPEGLLNHNRYIRQTEREEVVATISPRADGNRKLSQDMRSLDEDYESMGIMDEEIAFSDFEEPGSPEQSQRFKKQMTMKRMGSSLFKRGKGIKKMPSFLDDDQRKRRQMSQKEAKLKEYRKLKKYNSIFQYIVLVLIVASSITIAIDNPLNNPNSRLSKVLFIIDSIFTFLFLVEALLKIIAMGFCYSSIKGRKPYMCNGWNVLDFIVVLASLLDFSLAVAGISTSTLKALKALRTIRALRPLRVISRNEGLKLVVNALISSIPPMMNVLMVCILFVFIFAILGTNFFKGTFYRCQAPGFTGTKREECADGQWKNAMVHFDTSADAMLTLFEMLNLEGWIDVMWNGVDSVGIGMQPQRDNNQWYALYFIGFIIVGNMFLLNLFVGVVIDNFNQMKQKLGGYFWLTSEQKKWVEVQRLMIRMKLKFLVVEPQNKCRKHAYRIVMSKLFEGIIVTSIILNTIVMALVHYRINATFLLVLEIINYFFAALFNIEFILKLIALGKAYFSSKWNIFDFIIVIGTNMGIFLALIGSGINIGAAATGIRAFRIMRVIRLVNQSKHLRVILDTLVYILPSLANIGSMICLLIFIYSVLGMYIFAEVMYRDASAGGIGELRDYANFRQFGSAMLLLFRCATGESWNLIMHELADSSGDCVNSQTYQERRIQGIKGCGTVIAYPYFISFMLLISLMIMNLFVAVVIEGFQESRKDDEDSIINSRQLDTFLEKWSHFDPKAKGWIRPVDLAFLLHDIDQPLGYREAKEEKEAELMSQKAEKKRIKIQSKQLKRIAAKDVKSINKKLKKTIDPLEIAQLRQKRNAREDKLERDLKEVVNRKKNRIQRVEEFESQMDWTQRSIPEQADSSQTKKPKKEERVNRKEVHPLNEDDSHGISITKKETRIRPKQPAGRRGYDSKPTTDKIEKGYSAHETGEGQKDLSLLFQNPDNQEPGSIFQSGQKDPIGLSHKRNMTLVSKEPERDKKGSIKISQSMQVTNFGEHILQRGNILINTEQNIFVDQKRIREILMELQLSVYWYKNGDYIHIRDVLLALSQRVAVHKYGTKDMKINNFKMNQKLKNEWKRKHPELLKSKKVKSGDTGLYWAALVIQNFVRRWKKKRMAKLATQRITLPPSKHEFDSQRRKRNEGSKCSSRQSSRPKSQVTSKHGSRKPSREEESKNSKDFTSSFAFPKTIDNSRPILLPPMESSGFDRDVNGIQTMKAGKRKEIDPVKYTQRKSSRMGSVDELVGLGLMPRSSNRSGEDSSQL